MADPKQKLVVKDGWLEPLVTSIVGKGVHVVAPVEADGAVEFREIESEQQRVQNYVNARVPVKEVLFPRTEVILEYDRKPGEDATFGGVDHEPRPTVVFGARPCDLSGLGVLDTVLNWDYQDKFYNDRRAQTTLVGFACTEAGPHCFCQAVGGGPEQNDGSDILVRPLKDGGDLLEVMTERGEELAKEIEGATPATGAEAFLPSPETMAPFDIEKIKPWLESHFNDKFWTDMSLKCLGCAACSYLCPTCHCFDIVDEADWRCGERRRNWDCCSFSQFTQHTSGHNPRPDQQSRCRNRIMHKFNYFAERFGRRACVGCGRCIQICGAGQNLVNILTDIAKQEA